MLPTARAINQRRPWASSVLHTHCPFSLSACTPTHFGKSQHSQWNGLGKSWWFKFSVLSMTGSNQPGMGQGLESGIRHEWANQCDFYLIKRSLRTSCPPATLSWHVFMADQHGLPLPGSRSWAGISGTARWTDPSASYCFTHVCDELCSSAVTRVKRDWAPEGHQGDGKDGNQSPQCPTQLQKCWKVLREKVL